MTYALRGGFEVSMTVQQTTSTPARQAVPLPVSTVIQDRC
jgi:hypothetical protein